MTVKELMTEPVVTVDRNMPVSDVARVMQEHDIGAVVVVVDASGQLRGIVTGSDFTGIGRSVPFSLAVAPVVSARGRPPSPSWNGSTPWRGSCARGRS
jgi:CBS-domain-containing membrane protein